MLKKIFLKIFYYFAFKEGEFKLSNQNLTYRDRHSYEIATRFYRYKLYQVSKKNK